MDANGFQQYYLPHFNGRDRYKIILVFGFSDRGVKTKDLFVHTRRERDRGLFPISAKFFLLDWYDLSNIA